MVPDELQHARADLGRKSSGHHGGCSSGRARPGRSGALPQPRGPAAGHRWRSSSLCRLGTPWSAMWRAPQAAHEAGGEPREGSRGSSEAVAHEAGSGRSGGGEAPVVLQ
jgi:hypothetical protein